MEEAGVDFPLIEASAEDVPLPAASFDIVFCDWGAMTFCDPQRTVPEAARLLRSGGLFAFATGTPILDRGLYVLKTAAFRMVAVGGTTEAAALPILTALGPDGSTTVAMTPDGRVDAVGQAHPVGVGGSESRRADLVEAELRRFVPDLVRTDGWSGQDYRPFLFAGVAPVFASDPEPNYPAVSAADEKPNFFVQVFHNLFDSRALMETLGQREVILLAFIRIHSANYILITTSRCGEIPTNYGIIT